MELSDYIVYENASKVEVCAVLNGAKAGTDIRVYFELIPDNANVTGISLISGVFLLTFCR